MSEYKDPLLLEHEVDGIRELDNKLPRWWVWLFYLSITFAVIYLSVYHVFAKGNVAKYGQMAAEYQAEMKIGAALKVAAMGKFESGLATLQRSSDAAKQIKTLIKTSGEQVDNGVKFVGESGEALKRIVDQVLQINALVCEMAGAAEQQSLSCLVA